MNKINNKFVKNKRLYAWQTYSRVYSEGFVLTWLVEIIEEISCAQAYNNMWSVLKDKSSDKILDEYISNSFLVWITELHI